MTLRTSDFDYELPPELIAQTPPAVRGESRLLVVRRNDASTPGGKRSDSHQDGSGTLIIPPTGTVDRATLFSCQDGSFSDVVGLIPAGDLLVLNSTRVRHARLLGRRPSGAPAEVLLLHPAAGGEWIAMGKPGSALLPGKQIELGEGISIETLEVLADGYRRVRVVGASAEAAMRRVGRLPLPPYIERDPTPDDDARYQTVYAEREGSVAAPTAGLHFTHAMLSALAAKGAGIARLELEVGPGTFKPVEEEDPSRHPMHPERFEIPEAAAAAIAVTRRRGAAVWAVGTTVVRALESAAAPDGTVRPGAGETRLMITPGYRFRVVDHLITNFHLPRSTLLMLVSAFAGHDAAMAAYRIAVQLRYRFYSYGDAMAIL
ncbi:MAG TPA: tRNA preQ1(34) S-adenosylmethionine ribosyltransferase-isomerase QueA [Gemmatimonadales bacterium]|nr:tRNA preQ1(34) S-adenosylmethionine ribosyltransferase-isomerase QueA [Gemmatimonadales bacterium]